MPIVEASRQKNMPPDARTRHEPASIASNWASSRAKCRTALQMTTDAQRSGNESCSSGSTRKFSAGSAGARRAASARTSATASGSASAPWTS